MSDKAKRIHSMKESLEEQTFFISEEYARELRNAIVPVKILNSNGRVVDRAITKRNAEEQIKKRNIALLFLGHEPKKYEIISQLNHTSEYDRRRTKFNSNGESR